MSMPEVMSISSEVSEMDKIIPTFQNDTAIWVVILSGSQEVSITHCSPTGCSPTGPV